MNMVDDLLVRLAAADVSIWADGDKLRLSGPDKALTPALRTEIGAQKAALLERLRGAANGGPSPAPGAGARHADPLRLAAEEPALTWTGADLGDGVGVVPISDACHAEIAGLAALVRRNPMPLPALRPDDFDLPACRQMMGRVRRQLDDGVGFAVVDRIDRDAFSREEIDGVYWILASMVARPVALRWSGSMMYEVRDLGKRSLRAVDTNADLNYHVDNAFNVAPPDFVALFCLQKAKEGGMSKIVNMPAVHDEMRRRHPDLLARLYEPFVFDRQREHAEGEDPFIRRPIFENRDGRLVCRVSRFHVRTGHAVADEPLDAAGEQALDVMEEIMNRPGMAAEFWFEPGQIQIIDNRRLAHKRTGFVDWPEPERKRNLLRLWLRDTGRPFYNG